MTEVKYQRTKSEVFRFFVRQNFVRPRFWLPLLILLSWSVYVLSVARPGPSQIMGALGLALVVIVPLVMIRVSSLLAKKAAALGSLTLSFGDAGLTISGDDWKTELGWASFGKWSTTDEFVLLYYRKNVIPTLIPKRAFSPEQLADFLEHLQRIGRTPPKIKV
jgi:hypothetical protein